LTIEDPKPTGGGTDDPSGKKSEEDKKVAYSTYDKVLKEKKRTSEENQSLKERLADYEKAELEKEQKKLEEKGEYDKALAARDEQLKSEKEKFQALNERVRNGEKLSAFLKEVGSGLDEKYWDLVPIDQIAILDDGSVDASSVTQVAETFKERYGSDLIKKRSSSQLPDEQTPPGGKPGSSLTYNQWLALPPKERKTRMKDVDKSTM